MLLDDIGFGSYEFFFFFSFNVTFARYIARKKPRGDLLVTFKEL